MRVASSGSSTISSSSPPDSLQHVGGIMKHSSSLTSANLCEPQNTKCVESDQSGLERDRDDISRPFLTVGNNKISSSVGESLDGLAFANTTSLSATITTLPSAIPNSSVPAPKEEPEHNSDEGRGGICAI